MKKLLIITVLMATSFTTNASGGSRSGGKDRVLKNSMAGFVSESIEHSVRNLYRSNPSIKDQVAGASVQTLSDSDSTVTIELADGSELVYNCIRFDRWSNSGTVLKKEVVCRK